ncbi:MAG TPA: sigma-70 family RNA polymerase sigma factor [Gemmataceae bacterium]|jgi:RNA polymerase sigma factor (sigma-70 family)
MTRSLHTLIQSLRHSVRHRGDAALTDAQLLERWSGVRDPAAFELLLWRHGPMVLNTCRRLLSLREDVEDAFQATFLVFVRKAGSIRRAEALAPWLHRVACRIAGRVSAANSRRAGQEHLFTDEPAAPHVDTPILRDLHAILDEEIESLPAHYRRALVLCCLEGKSQEEAALLLHRPRGTVSSWLTRGRERLRQRLLRRGIVVSAAGLTAALTPDALASGGMIPLVASLVRLGGAVVAGGPLPTELMPARAIALAEGVLRMMLMTKVKIVTAIGALVAVAAVGVGTWSHAIWAADDTINLTEKQPQESRQRRLPSKEISPKEPLPDLTHLTLQFNEEKGIAWGEKAHGLQAGIALRRGDQETYEVGQSVTFVVYLRNVSDKKIDLSHFETLFDEWMPVVEDSEGRRLAVAPGPIQLGIVPIIHRSLASGQQIMLSHPWFRIRPLGWRGEVIGPTCCAGPGRYKVGYANLPLRLSDGKDISLGTKQLELDIRKRETVKGERAGKNAPVVEQAMPVIPAIGKPEETRLFFVNTRSIGIPLTIDTRNQELVRELILVASKDGGRTWEQVDKKLPTERCFRFHVNSDGMYWLIIQQVDNQGRCVPANPSRAKPSLRICVDTKPPVGTSMARHDNRSIHLTWTAKDANLPDLPVTLEWSEKRSGPWKTIVSGRLPSTGDFEWKLPNEMPSDLYVRIHFQDKADNHAYTPASYFNLKEDE